MEKLDLKKVRKPLFTAPLNRFVTINVPPVSYLMVDGHGDPNTAQAYKLAVESLYATAFTIKFSCKANGKDFVVMPLEGLWSAPDPESFSARRKDEWEWTMMIMVPDYVDDETFLAARIKAREKLGTLPESLRLESLEEGLCLQALHVGSYDDEGPLLAMLHGEIMPSGGYDFAGWHHEVYLSDPRKTAPEKLKTVIRQPVRQN
ncbi:GyrI-like domain-containing protein [Bradyrhizobium sp. sBnM-33]|uniref:GyrI-like domain-containing protein n=1 Tax=Bradyrhizobium sp. sBnM-33 TaxID=2831780 RepID=UPI001BCD7C66|nr:GyrI-like domain-containing protein [Bradyrhizobium sp. sBnM-33]WOH50396.1 GyrI-like domain-containing protein [Bradyrhizobium sp. sBnM-33]